MKTKKYKCGVGLKSVNDAVDTKRLKELTKEFGGLKRGEV